MAAGRGGHDCLRSRLSGGAIVDGDGGTADAGTASSSGAVTTGGGLIGEGGGGKIVDAW